MPVSSPNTEYIQNLPLWVKVRDSVRGEDAIKAAGIAYLPKPSGQSDEDYKRYMGRVHFTDFTCRTADGLHGNIFSRLPVQSIEPPELFKDFLENVDLSGTSINQFASDLCWDVMQTGWGGILVDHPNVPEDWTVSDVENAKLKSFMRWYTAETVINWRYETIGHKRMLALVVLKETSQIAIDDEFIFNEEVSYRVLRLTGGIYTQQIYVKNKDEKARNDEYLPLDVVIPKLQGKPLGFIPFYFCPSHEPEKSMLLGLAYENIGHYQKSADYEHDIHYTGMHTPYVAGMRPPIDPVTKKPMDVKIGGSSFIFLDGDGDKIPQVGYLETKGSENILKAINACEERMAILGARIISIEKKGVETAEAAKIHRAGENSVLGAFARNMSERLTLAARFCALWRGVQEEITEQWRIELNLDYEGDLSQAEEKRIGLLELDAGVISRMRYLSKFGGMTEKEAENELQIIDNERKLAEKDQEMNLNEFPSG